MHSIEISSFSFYRWNLNTKPGNRECGDVTDWGDSNKDDDLSWTVDLVVIIKLKVVEGTSRVFGE